MERICNKNDYDIHIYSHDPTADITLEEAFKNLDCPELFGKISFHRMENLYPLTWGKEFADFDIVFCQMYQFAGILEKAKGINNNLKVISWIHSILIEEHLAHLLRNGEQMQFAFRQQDKLVKLSDICVFDSVMDLERGLLDFPNIREKSQVIYPVSRIDQGYIVKKPDGSIDTSEVSKLSEITLTFIGRWDYRKGIEHVMPCCFKMFAEHNVKTVILSDFHLYENYQHMFTSITTRFQFRSLVDSGAIQLVKWKSDRREYLRFLGEKPRVAVLPSLYDPFNIIAYDCAVMGVPLVLSNRCGAAEILEQGEALAVCNPLLTDCLYEKILAMCATAISDNTIMGANTQKDIQSMWDGFHRILASLTESGG